MKNNLRLQEQRNLCRLFVNVFTEALSMEGIEVTEEELELLQNRTGLGGVEPQPQSWALSVGSQSYASGVERGLKTKMQRFLDSAGAEGLEAA